METIKFKAVKHFGRVDYFPMDDKAGALCNLKGRKLQRVDIESLMSAGFKIEIS